MGQFFNRNKQWFWLVTSGLIVFFLIMLLGHDYFGTFIANTWDINDRPQFNALFDKAGYGMLLVFVLLITYGLLKNKSERPTIILYSVLTIGLAILAYRYLLVVHSEIMHYPQYAVIGFLLFLVLRNYPEALFMTILLGSLDEGYQYFSLAPEKTAYLDMNDMLLNAIGAAFGLLIAKATIPDFNRPKEHYFSMFSLIPILCLLLAAGVATLFGLGILAYQPEGAADPNTYYLLRQPLTDFWSKQDFNVTYHIIRPLEGVVYLLLFFILYFPLNHRTKNGIEEPRQT